ncbi:pyridoxal phosphate-dependent decarboxylase family protein [Aspergillus alliaceus]|uniref:pyridoxal phosphate-dependent decarboxylase family protein n=1 Tax=Petromyces alliaceus TaxID=209559 RepID=UPI0012A5E93F|nr:pyridoxal phosphate-dependent transferase [Aspergillus alliaceus]KAB8232677.1 pyridoxal phosphate-dependent transferase [Aspergillus alliaceus]
MPTDSIEKDALPVGRVTELTEAIEIVLRYLIPFLRSSEDDYDALTTGMHLSKGCYANGDNLDSYLTNPGQLRELLSLKLPSTGRGMEDIASSTATLLQYSVNTSSPAFMDKLWSSPSIPGIASDLLLSALNGNDHVFRVSPALTLIEKHVAKELAQLFGLSGPYSGGVSVPGGAAANNTALLVARNVRFPHLKDLGLHGTSFPRLVMFASEAAHFSVLNAAQILGLGSHYIKKIATTVDGCMDPMALKQALDVTVAAGEVPLFVCGTAGTTVRGAYDPLESIGKLAHEYNAWFHVDACWGGAAAFSNKLKYKLAGCNLADSIAYNPHKLLGVPQICSFLLGRDLRTFWYANSLTAGYLFHQDESLPPSEGRTTTASEGKIINNQAQERSCLSYDHTNWRTSKAIEDAPDPQDVYDLASFTPQCGRRPDAVKLYFHWRYYGAEGIATQVEGAYEGARYLSRLIGKEPSLRLVGHIDVPCTQVCFYYVGASHKTVESAEEMARQNTFFTRLISTGLLKRGWMVDYAPGCGRREELGAFLRVACNRMTTPSVAEGLVQAILEVIHTDIKSIPSSYK